MSQKWVDLANKLIRLTFSGKLDWNETSEEDMFQTAVGGIVIQFEHVTSFDDVFSIAILTKDGKRFDGFTNEDLSKIDRSEWYLTFQSMFQTIQRQISGADKILDDLLAQLDKKDDEIPF